MIIVKELDVVELKDGREATVLEVCDEGKAFLVEIVDDDGKTLEMPIIKAEDIVRTIWEKH